MNKGEWTPLPCKFNHGVCCQKGDRDKCAVCGWNPAEDELRRRRIRETGTPRPTRQNYMAHVKGEELQAACRSWTGLKRGFTR